MSEKARKIMKVLLINQGTPITVKMLAVMLDMSERSVNTYLKEVGAFCEEHRIPFVSKRGVGIYLEPGSSRHSLTAELLNQKSVYDRPGERIHYILDVLLAGWNSYSITLLEQELYVSRQTIVADLEAAGDWLSGFGLKLIKKSKTGLTLLGSEWNRRRAIAALNREQSSDGEDGGAGWGTACDFRLGRARYHRLQSCYSEPIVRKICRAMQVYEQRLGNNLIDYCYVMLAEYLCVQLQRMEGGYCAEQKEHGIDLAGCLPESAREFKLLVESLEMVTRRQYPEPEQDYISIVLAGAEFQKITAACSLAGPYVTEQQVGAVCRRIIDYLTDVTGLNFDSEKRLLSGVESFLCKCIVRTYHGITIENPFLEEVKKNYGAIFTTCFGLGSYVRDLIGTLPSEHEVAYLTLLVGGALVRIDKHVDAVFVGAGNLLIAEMTARKLEKKAGSLRIIAVLSPDQKEEIAALNYELIITTISEYEHDRPIVYVTPIIDDRDTVRLQKACNDVFAAKLGGMEPVKLNDFIKPEYILLDVDAAPKEKLIELGCRVLREHGCVTEAYGQEILRREQVSSTEIGNGVAIPHGIENTVLIPSICMLRLKKKTDWGNAPVDIIFMLALNFNDLQTTRQFFKLFYEKAGQASTVDAIRRAANNSEIMQVLVEEGVSSVEVRAYV